MERTGEDTLKTLEKYLFRSQFYASEAAGMERRRVWCGIGDRSHSVRWRGKKSDSTEAHCNCI